MPAPSWVASVPLANMPPVDPLAPEAPLADRMVEEWVDAALLTPL